MIGYELEAIWEMSVNIIAGLFALQGLWILIIIAVIIAIFVIAVSSIRRNKLLKNMQQENRRERFRNEYRSLYARFNIDRDFMNEDKWTDEKCYIDDIRNYISDEAALSTNWTFYTRIERVRWKAIILSLVTIWHFFLSTQIP